MLLVMFPSMYVLMFYIPFTVNIPELVSLPMSFLAWQVYVPASGDLASTIVSKLSTTNSLTAVVVMLNSFDLCQLIVGTGLPVALQMNVTVFVSFSTASVTSLMISAATKHKHYQYQYVTFSQ